MNFPVFDLHCDTALAVLGKDLMDNIDLGKNDLHIDLERAGKLPGYCQCFACFTTPEMRNWYQASPLVVFEREMGAILSGIDKYSKKIALAYCAADVRANLEKRKMSAILTMEGPAGISYDAQLLQDLYLVGFRMTTLGWNEQNILTGSNVTGGGLTDAGKAFVKEAQRIGMMVDVSHISDEAFWDIMKISEKPIIASHSNSRSVCDVSRNLTDDMFRAICESGGVAGFNQYTAFVGDHATLDTACDHILHWLELDPEGTHIALGGDLDGCDSLCEGFDGVQSYPALAQRLLERGLTEELVRKIYWDNALGVFETCCM